MRIPTRKSEDKKHVQADPYITQDKYDALKSKHERLLRTRPSLAKEVARLGELGDFSENAEYQIAKGKLRGLNHRLLVIEETLRYSKIIQTNSNTNQVRLGHKVTVEVNGKTKIYQILGSTETNPTTGIISHNSPIGKALLGDKIGQTVTLSLSNNKTSSYKIIKIES